jgi:hypothetical protein
MSSREAIPDEMRRNSDDCEEAASEEVDFRLKEDMVTDELTAAISTPTRRKSFES